MQDVPILFKEMFNMISVVLYNCLQTLSPFSDRLIDEVLR